LAVEKRTRHVVSVGVAQFRMGQAPMQMTTMALGSCLGIVLYDASSKIGALAHAMHPYRERVKNNANKAKFVDTVIPVVVGRMVHWGARRERIVAKIFGGARMFESVAGCPGVLQIGDENIIAAREVLDKLGIPIAAECVGGTSGRTIVFDVSNGRVTVRRAGSSEELY
jgi:chemotaxis protein CheD